METIARSSFAIYDEFVYQTPGFTDYFWQATPIDLIEHLRIGSRPARRQQSNDVRQLRAIPWVLSWTQSRHMLSAWYGIGQSLERFAGRALDVRTKLGVVLGYGAHWNSYQVFVGGLPRPYWSSYRLFMPARWSAEKLQEVNVTLKDQHHPRGARAVPFVDRDVAPEQPVQGRAPRRLELRQGDFNPAMGGFG